MQENTTLLGAAGGKTEAAPEAPIRYCLYARKSTEQDEKQALSIDSQIREMLQIAERDKLEIVEIQRESHSAKASSQRPVFNQLLADIRTGKFNGIVTWMPDRLSRNAGDLGALIDLIDQKRLVEIRTYSQRFTDSPNEKFLLSILLSQSKLENDNKGLNVKRGLRARIEMGLWPGVAPTGYLNEKRTDRKCEVIVDPKRAPVIKTMFEKVGNDGWSGRKVFEWLNGIKFTTKNGKPLSLSNVYIILANPFYIGILDYPKGSGKWYPGRHQAIVDKELYDKVQAQVTRNKIARDGNAKEFAFTRLMTCGLCGSGITAMEKFKRQLNGNVHRYVYYTCTKSRNTNCKGNYIREDALVIQLSDIIDRVSLNELGLRKRIEHEVERYRTFRYGVLGFEKDKEKIRDGDIDAKDYAKYVLKSGSTSEKRELMSCLKSKLVLEGKALRLA